MRIVREALGVGDSCYFENIVPIIIDEENVEFDDNNDNNNDSHSNTMTEMEAGNHASFSTDNHRITVKDQNNPSFLGTKTMSSKSFFDHLKKEIKWYEMRHKEGLVPRLIAIQGDIILTTQRNHINESVILVKNNNILSNDSKAEIKNNVHRSVVAHKVISPFQIPLYRHPFDSHPPFCAFTPTILYIKRLLENDQSLRAHINSNNRTNSHNNDSHGIDEGKHPDLHFNHVLIQYYRSGSDFISEHADKTLDVAKGSVIVNVSFGVTRTFVLKPKKGVRNIKKNEKNNNSHDDDDDDYDIHNNDNRVSDCHCKKSDNTEYASDSLTTTKPLSSSSSSSSAPLQIDSSSIQPMTTARMLTTQKVKLRDNSMFVLGWETNRYYLHSIPRDKGMMTIKGEEFYEGERISLTFRSIATCLHSDGRLTGQGARWSSGMTSSDSHNSDIGNHNCIHNHNSDNNITGVDINETDSHSQKISSSLNGDDNDVISRSQSTTTTAATVSSFPLPITAAVAGGGDHDATSTLNTTSLAVPAAIPVMIDYDYNDNNARAALIHINRPSSSNNSSMDWQREKERLYEAYSNENRIAGFVWDSEYVDGFNVW